jgi:hypothetical protein
MVGCASVSVSRSRLSLPCTTELQAVTLIASSAASLHRPVALVMINAMCRRHATRGDGKYAVALRHARGDRT